MLETARQIIGALTDQTQTALRTDRLIFRAGVWKPRTRPDTFQGAGEAALGWLAEVKATYGMPVATEVATPEHVQAALEAGIDYLWIGARTSANPIAVQEIVESLKLIVERSRLDESFQLKALLIKNPVNADAGLWLGNIERLEQTGVPVMAVHRGCGHQPCWSMAHQVRTARQDIPMLLDPSHMSGDAKRVPELTGKIEELGLDGAMIEVHCNPAEALSDKNQQISPAGLERLRLTEDRPASPDRTQTDSVELNWLRAEIDELDDALWGTIAARMDVSRRIGEWKKAHGVAPLQPERFNAILEQRKQWAVRKGIPESFVEQIFESIHKQSLREQI